MIPRFLSDICNSFITKDKAHEGFDIPMNKYILPDEFLKQLKIAVKYAPCNQKQKRKRIVMTVFSAAHKWIVSNLLCSIVHIKNYSQNYHIFISYDKEGFDYLNQFRRKLIPFNYTLPQNRILLLNVSKRHFEYEQYTNMKSILQYQLALWNVESIVIDSDIVLFKDFNPIFDDTCDITITAENCCKFKFDHNFNYYEFNIGFSRFIPSPEVRFVFRQWIRNLIPTHRLDQKVLQVFVAPHKRTKNVDGTNIHYYKFDEIELPISIKFIHPLDFLNGGMIKLAYKRTKFEMKNQNKTDPYGIHFAWIRQKDKIPFMMEHNFWYFDHTKGQCKVNPPTPFFKTF